MAKQKEPKVSFTVRVRTLQDYPSGTRAQWLTVANGVTREQALKQVDEWTENAEFGQFDKVEVIVEGSES